MDVKNDQIKLLEEDNQRWKERANQILQKYDRIDPAELEALKEKVNTLENEKAELATNNEELETSNQELTEKVTTINANWRAKLDKLVADTKEKLRELRSQMADKSSQIDTLKSEVETVRAELEQAKKERQDAVAGIEFAKKQAAQQAVQQALAEPNRQLAAAQVERVKLQKELEELKQSQTANQTEQVSHLSGLCIDNTDKS